MRRSVRVTGLVGLLLTRAAIAQAEPTPPTTPDMRLSAGGGIGLVRIVDQQSGAVWGQLHARSHAAFGRLAWSPTSRAELAIDVQRSGFTRLQLSEPSYDVYGDAPREFRMHGAVVSATFWYPRVRLTLGAGAYVRSVDDVYTGTGTAGVQLAIGTRERLAGLLRLGSLRGPLVDPVFAAVGVAHESRRGVIDASCGYAMASLPALRRSVDEAPFRAEDGRGRARGLQCVLDARVVLTPQLELTFSGHAGRQLPFASLGLAARFGEAHAPRRVRRPRRAPPPPAYGPAVDATDPSAPLRVLPPGAPPAGTLAPP